MEKTRHLNAVPVGRSAAGAEDFWIATAEGPLAIRDATDEQLAQTIAQTLQLSAQLQEQFNGVMQAIGANGANFSVLSYEVDRRKRILTIASHLQN